MKKMVWISIVMVCILSILTACNKKEVADIVTDTPVQNTPVETMNTDEKMTEETKEMMDDSSSDTMMKTEQTTEEKMMDTESTMEKKVWDYVSYNPDIIASTSGNKVLFFHASWCPSCRSADSHFSSATFPADLTVIKTNFDTSGDLKEKYEVTSQHTFVQVDSEGNLVSKWIWSRTVDDIVEKLK